MNREILNITIAISIWILAGLNISIKLNNHKKTTALEELVELYKLRIDELEDEADFYKDEWKKTLLINIKLNRRKIPYERKTTK